MVTATSTNQLIFRGKSGRRYTLNCYISDVVAASVLMNINGAAGTASANYWRAPEPVVLTDASIITGPTVAVGMNLQQDGATVAGASLLFGTYLNTLAKTPQLAVAFPAGALIGAVQF